MNFIFYESFYKSVQNESQKVRSAFYSAILDYYFKGIEPTENSPCYGYFLLAKPNIDIMKMKQDAGSKGGSKRGSKQQANAEVSDKQTTREKEKEKEIDIEKPAASRAPAHAKPTQQQFVDGCLGAGVPEDFARSLFAELEGFGWKDGDGRDIGSWQRYAKRTYLERRREAAAAEPTASGFRRISEADL